MKILLFLFIILAINSFAIDIDTLFEQRLPEIDKQFEELADLDHQDFDNSDLDQANQAYKNAWMDLAKKIQQGDDQTLKILFLKTEYNIDLRDFYIDMEYVESRVEKSLIQLKINKTKNILYELETLLK